MRALEQPRSCSALRSLRIVGSVTPKLSASSPIRARPRTETSSAIRACRSSAKTGPSSVAPAIAERNRKRLLRTNIFESVAIYFRSLLTGSLTPDKTIGIETASDIRSKRRVGILTSGGDAPGMNAVVAGACEQRRARRRRARRHPWRLRRPAAGATPQRDHVAGARPTRTRPGTWLGTSRWPELRSRSGRDACRRALEALGPRRPARDRRRRLGATVRARSPTRPVAVVPATIDRDLAGTELTIGTDSAIGYAIDAIDRLRITGPLAARPRVPVADARRAQRLPRRRRGRGRRHRRRARPRAPVRPGRDRRGACSSCAPAAPRSP